MIIITAQLKHFRSIMIAIILLDSVRYFLLHCKSLVLVKRQSRPVSFHLNQIFVQVLALVLFYIHIYLYIVDRRCMQESGVKCRSIEWSLSYGRINVVETTLMSRQLTPNNTLVCYTLLENMPRARGSLIPIYTLHSTLYTLYSQ